MKRISVSKECKGVAKFLVGSIFFVLISIFAIGTFNPVLSQGQIVRIDGSSTVYPITEAVAEEFQKAMKGAIKVTVGISGTGGGFKKFSRGEIDIANASRPIRRSEIEECKKQGIEFIELPVAFDGLAVVVNPKNTWVKSLTIADLRRMWEPAALGKVTRWSDVRPEWPNERLNLFGPGADSGTFDYFTEAVVGKARSSRGDFTASEDDNVLVMGVAGDRNALGYFGMAYYEENKGRVRVVPIVDPATHKEVTPSLETVMDGTYRPLSRPLFIYVNRKSLERPEVREFVSFYLRNLDTLVRQARYVPPTAGVIKLATERFTKMTTGSMFGGDAMRAGVRLEELMK